MNRIPVPIKNNSVKDADYLPPSSFIGESDFKNPFEIKAALKDEIGIDGPSDDPIPVPVAKLMKFKLGQPEVKKFSI
jgi:hypothetical protein